MNNFTYENHTKLIFGKNTVDSLKEELETRGYKKILLHYGGGSIKRIGLYDKVMEILKEIECEVFELGGVEPNPKLGKVKEGIKITKENDVDLILVVGGGSAIDSAKAIGIGHCYDGDVWDYYEGKVPVTETLPVATILTIPATGSESSTGSVITNEDGLYKRSAGDVIMRPVFSILDPEITMSLDARLTFTGIMDIISHILERYFTQTEKTDFIDKLSEGAMKSIIENSYALKEDLNDYDARAEIMLAGTIAHNGMLGIGRQDDWGSHKIAHEMSSLYDTTHGASLGIIFPAWMKYVYKENPKRFVQFATNVFNVSTEGKSEEEIIKAGIQGFENWLTAIDVPTRFSHDNIPTDEFELMASKAVEDGPIGNFKKLEKEDVIAIYELAK